MRSIRTLVRILPIVAALPFAARAQSAQEIAGWERRAAAITITRDDWGIAHVRGRTDADAVFGMIYAQAEDDFNRVETNYLNSMGRLAEAEGESAIWQDLRMKLFIHPDSMKAKYASSPTWLKTLMDAWADGLNYYLHTHPTVTPRVIRRFEPWMALTFSEGSIGGDIERVNLQQLSAFYGRAPGSPPPPPAEPEPEYREPSGSNGIAIAPSNTVNRRSLLWINPHTSFFFRSELQMTSDEGLNAYGAVTWGQFFIYQGFNERSGWMHTSSSVDQLDEYLVTVTQRDGRRFYRHGTTERPVVESRIVVPYRGANGTMARREFTVYRTHHGPITREVNGRWVAMRLMHEPVKALTQSYTRTKARNYREFLETMQLHTNSSNNTIFADAEGNIAYFHANFIPRRDTSFNWRQPVDGNDPRTEWGPLLGVTESPHLLNPATGWLYNTNNSPWSAAGPNSPKQSAFAPYVDNGAENPRGVHALRVLTGKTDFTIQSLIDAGYSTWLPAFAESVPPLIRAYDALPASNPLKARLAEQIEVLRRWDHRWAASSIATSLAIFWGETPGGRANASAEQMLQGLATASDKLAADFGSWKTPWGDINRFQRLTGDIVQPFNDAAPSIAVPFPSARYGSLASFGARAYPGTRKWYGTSGNSFVAVVEFGRDSVRARAISAGGESGDPRNRHFNDQAMRYAAGQLRDVYFYPSQLVGHTERQYRPGQRP